MGLEINRPLGVGGITSNISIPQTGYNIWFGNTNTDSFERTSSDRYTNEAVLKKLIASNPKIKNITKNFNPEMNLNMDEINELLQHHAKDTQNIAKGIINNLPFSLKTRADEKAIEDAAYLHDMGKVLIPKEILNKPSKLNEAETNIMHKHSELSYELLKNTDLSKTTLNLIRNHHQNAKKTGYPWVDNSFNADLNLQILTAADKYSALTEHRTYKAPLAPKQALTIIYQDVKDGKLHPFVFKALVNYANSYEYAQMA